MTVSSIGERLKLVRQYSNLTIQELADDLKIHYGSLHNYETDKRPLPIDLAKQICERFAINANWLVIGHGQMLDDSMASLTNRSQPHIFDFESQALNERFVKIEESLDEINQILQK